MGEYEELQSAVTSKLQHLPDLTKNQLAAFQANDQALLRLDKNLDNAVGEKERAIGALRQHVKDHKVFLDYVIVVTVFRQTQSNLEVSSPIGCEKLRRCR